MNSFFCPISYSFVLLLVGLGPTGCADDDAGLGKACYLPNDCAEHLFCVNPRGADGVEPGVSEYAAKCTAVPRTDPGSVYVDPTTKLQWQQTPTAGNMDWSSASKHCRTLLLDGSGWRLPTVEELRSLIRGCASTADGGACAATSTCITYDLCLSDCSGCDTSMGPSAGCYWPDELGGDCSWYWTSTSLDDDNGAWYVVFSHAHVCGRSKEQQFGLVRCVR